MKKLFTIILILSFICGYGQSIKLFYNDAVVNSNDTVTINVTGSDDHYLDFVNTSAQDINLMIKRTVISLLPGAETYFCFYDCLAETVNSLPNPVPFIAGDTFSHKKAENDDEYFYYFYAHYDPHGQKGISLVKFDFMDNDNKNDVSSVIFKFNSNSSSIADNQTVSLSLNAYPNPVTSKVYVQYDLKNHASKARLLVSNLIGVTLKSIPLGSTANRMQIDLSDFSSGIYFYSLEINGKIAATKKLIVK
jgi:hypothetical protein